MSLLLTDHAVQRLAQRGLTLSHLELAMFIASEVEGGFFVRNDDARQAARQLRDIAASFERLAGKRIVASETVVVTGYHATPAKVDRLLRQKVTKRRKGRSRT